MYLIGVLSHPPAPHKLSRPCYQLSSIPTRVFTYLPRYVNSLIPTKYITQHTSIIPLPNSYALYYKRHHQQHQNKERNLKRKKTLSTSPHHSTHHGDDHGAAPTALRASEADPRAQSPLLHLQLLALPPLDLRPRLPAQPARLQSLCRGPLPGGLLLRRPTRRAERGEQHERELQLARVQALAARPVQEGRELRVPARVQPAQDARVQLLRPQRLLLQRRRVPLSTHRPPVQVAPLPALRPRLLPPGPDLQQKARAPEAVPVLPRRLLPRGQAVQGRRAPAVGQESREADREGGCDTRGADPERRFWNG